MTKKEKQEFLYNYNLENAIKLSGGITDASKSPFLQEINELGYNIDYWVQLDCLPVDVRLIPILKKHILNTPILHPEKFSQRDTFIRMLGHKEYNEATEFCLQQYHQAPKRFSNCYAERWVWGLTICNIMDSRYIADYIKIISDETDYSCFTEILILLSKLKEKSAIPYILKYLQYSLEGKWRMENTLIEALGNYRSAEYLQYLEPFLAKTFDAYTRNKASAAIKKIKKASGME